MMQRHKVQTETIIQITRDTSNHIILSDDWYYISTLNLDSLKRKVLNKTVTLQLR